MLFGRVGLLGAVIVVVGVGGCRWSDVPKDAVYACSNGACPTGQECQQGYCFPAQPQVDAGGVDGGCIPTRCAAVGKNCGDVGDGCGSMLHCGVCKFPTTCGGGGISNVCGCDASPIDAGVVCAQADAGCGTISRIDNCGVMQVLSCGPMECACTAYPAAVFCADAGFNCGSYGITDNCGHLQEFSCGACTGTDTCLTGDFGGVCGKCVPEDDWTFCDLQGANCGGLSGTDNCGVVRNNVDCGACKKDCLENLCECQPNLRGCTKDAQCCMGNCGTAGLCCAKPGHACTDDSDCCQGACTQNFCEQLPVQ